MTRRSVVNEKSGIAIGKSAGDVKGVKPAEKKSRHCQEEAKVVKHAVGESISISAPFAEGVDLLEVPNGRRGGDLNEKRQCFGLNCTGMARSDADGTGRWGRCPDVLKKPGTSKRSHIGQGRTGQWYCQSQLSGILITGRSSKNRGDRFTGGKLVREVGRPY